MATGDRRSVQSPTSWRVVAQSKAEVGMRSKWTQEIFRMDVVEKKKGRKGQPLTETTDGGAKY